MKKLPGKNWYEGFPFPPSQIGSKQHINEKLTVLFLYSYSAEHRAIACDICSKRETLRATDIISGYIKELLKKSFKNSTIFTNKDIANIQQDRNKL